MLSWRQQTRTPHIGIQVGNQGRSDFGDWPTLLKHTLVHLLGYALHGLLTPLWL